MIDDWVITKKLKTPAHMNLSTDLLLPGFDWNEFPFMVLYSKDTYDLFNLKTGVRSTLIQGSNGTPHNPLFFGPGKWKSTFFADHGNGKLDFHFSTSSVNEEN